VLRVVGFIRESIKLGRIGGLSSVNSGSGAWSFSLVSGRESMIRSIHGFDRAIPTDPHSCRASGFCFQPLQSCESDTECRGRFLERLRADHLETEETDRDAEKADGCGTGGTASFIEMVPVGNPGNETDLGNIGEGDFFGVLSYEYRIGETGGASGLEDGGRS
jgi:hypothetical protein